MKVSISVEKMDRRSAQEQLSSMEVNNFENVPTGASYLISNIKGFFKLKFNFLENKPIYEFELQKNDKNRKKILKSETEKNIKQLNLESEEKINPHIGNFIKIYKK
jgi:hypothetical protein